MKVLLLGLGAAVWLALSVYLVIDDRKFAKLGATALVEPIDGYTVETKTTKKLLRPDQVNVSKSAKMVYTDKNGRKVTFTRFLSEDLIKAFTEGREVYVEYIPGEWNTERFKGEKSNAWMFMLLFVAFAGALVYVARKPPREDGD